MAGVGRFDHNWIRCGITIGAVAVAFLLRMVLTKWVGPSLPTFVTFYPAVMLVAIVFGLWGGLLATMMVAVISAYWIFPPEGFAIELLSDLVGLCVFLIMGVLMSVVAEFYRRTRQQAHKRSLELAKANEALRDLSMRLLSAQEDERKRIAGEVHDTLGACLSAIKFRVVDLLDANRKPTAVVTESLNTVVPLIQEAIEECRRIQMDLRPSMLDDLGVLPTLSWFCRRFETVYSAIRIEQQFAIEEGEIPGPLKIVIYRVTQEAMNNIAKHSKASIVRLCLRTIDGRMDLVVEDNGSGFNPENVASLESTGRGLGLRSMRERTEFTGGSFSIESVEGKGTIIRASWLC